MFKTKEGGGGQNDCVLQIKIDDIERIRWMEKH